MDLFNNPVGYRTSLGKMLRLLLFLSSCCRTFGSPETEVSEQLYYCFKTPVSSETASNDYKPAGGGAGITP
jgi:hypothetical protein